MFSSRFVCLCLVSAFFFLWRLWLSKSGKRECHEVLRSVNGIEIEINNHGLNYDRQINSKKEMSSAKGKLVMI